MSTVTKECETQPSMEGSFNPTKQLTQLNSIQKSSNKKKTLHKKTVQFNCPPPTVKSQAFETTESNHSETIRSDRSINDDSDLNSSSINIIPTKKSNGDHKPTCSRRTKTILTIIIVILIILAIAGIAIGITFGTIKSQQNSSGTTTTKTNNPSSLSTLSTTLITSIVSIGSQSGAPCTSYTTINDPTRNVAQTGIYSTCDTGSLFNASNGGSWIRFVGTGGTTMPLTSPGMYHCGGYLSAWYNGTLPTTVGTIVNGSVCIDAVGSSCMFFIGISVVDCGGFYIYFLRSLSICNTRYCTT